MVLSTIMGLSKTDGYKIPFTLHNLLFQGGFMACA